ncbi:hypothetical protein HanPSC8_Chr07g0269931 [Helianthus annuus]|nr:hypothetical protein HanPSC8_Chr07g0269931 [Helianthus annuus]
MVRLKAAHLQKNNTLSSEGIPQHDMLTGRTYSEVLTATSTLTLLI